MWTGLALACALFAASSLEAAVAVIRKPEQIHKAFPAKANVRVVNVWATWCGPCVKEMPDLRDIAKELPGVAFVGVSLDDAIPGDRAEIRKRVETFLRDRNVTFPNLYYSGNTDSLVDYLKFDGVIPITIAFDRSGKELWRHQGPINRRETTEKLRNLLRRKP
jgi:thiol-disulfide isomerase/thioredoxin